MKIKSEGEGKTHISQLGLRLTAPGRLNVGLMCVKNKQYDGLRAKVDLQKPAEVEFSRGH